MTEARQADLMMTELIEWIGTKEAAKRLGVSPNTARKILAKEKTGVHLICTPGHTKPMYRIQSSVVDRILRRTTPA